MKRIFCKSGIHWENDENTAHLCEPKGENYDKEYEGPLEKYAEAFKTLKGETADAKISHIEYYWQH